MAFPQHSVWGLGCSGDVCGTTTEIISKMGSRPTKEEAKAWVIKGKCSATLGDGQLDGGDGAPGSWRRSGVVWGD